MQRYIRFVVYCTLSLVVLEFGYWRGLSRKVDWRREIHCVASAWSWCLFSFLSEVPVTIWAGQQLHYQPNGQWNIPKSFTTFHDWPDATQCTYWVNIFSSSGPLDERISRPTSASKCNESIYEKLYSHPAAAAAGSGAHSATAAAAAAGQNIVGDLIHVQDSALSQKDRR